MDTLLSIVGNAGLVIGVGIIVLVLVVSVNHLLDLHDEDRNGR